MEKRTTEELIGRLESERHKFFAVGIAVGFETETKFVFGSDENKLQRLNQLVEAGGEPVGMIAVTQIFTEGHQTLTGYTKYFDGYEWADEYLTRLLQETFKGLGSIKAGGSAWLN